MAIQTGERHDEMRQGGERYTTVHGPSRLSTNRSRAAVANLAGTRSRSVAVIHSCFGTEEDEAHLP